MLPNELPIWVRRVGFLLGLLMAYSPAISAQQPNVELLWPNGTPGGLGEEKKDQPTLICYPATGESKSKTAVVICPGGGYGHQWENE